MLFVAILKHRTFLHIFTSHNGRLYLDATSQLSRHVLVDILRGDHSLEKSLGDDDHLTSQHFTAGYALRFDALTL